MLDVHSHVLPWVDDGPSTLDEAVEIIVGLKQLGFSHVVATPHYYPGLYTPTMEAIDKAFDALQESLRDRRILVDLTRGRECFLDYELMVAQDRESFPFVLDGQKYQLIELPPVCVPNVLSEYVRILAHMQIVPLLAHAERYQEIIQEPGVIQRFIEMGFRIQVDVGSFCPAYFKSIRRTAIDLLKNNRIDVLGSDVHDLGQLDMVAQGLEWIRNEFGLEKVQELTKLNPTSEYKTVLDPRL